MSRECPASGPGTYLQRTPADPEKEIGTHQTLINLTRQQSARAAVERRKGL